MFVAYKEISGHLSEMNLNKSVSSLYGRVIRWKLTQRFSPVIRAEPVGAV